MAEIRGVASGLMAGDVEAPRKKNKVPVLYEHCTACEGRLPKTQFQNSTFLDHTEGNCSHCALFFGFDSSVRRGCTDLSPEEVKRKFAELRERKWGMILRAGSYGTANGLTVTVEPGDMFHVTRIGMEDANEEEYCSAQRTKEMFTVTINIGPIPLVLFPHELSPISFVTILEMKRDGEVEEAFVSSNDQAGHFRPTAALRQDIYDTFGHLVNAPRQEQDDESEPPPIVLAPQKPRRTRRKTANQ